MASTWTEYLVLERQATHKNWKLFVGKYEVLAECWAYYKEDLNEFKLPKTINGVKVVGTEDEWVVGGPLQAWEHPAINFVNVGDDVLGYVKDHCISPNEALAELDRVISKLGPQTLIKAFNGEQGRFNLWLDSSMSKPTLTLRQAFTDPKKHSPIFTVTAPNSRKLLNAVRSAWLLALRRDVSQEEVRGISWLLKDLAPAMAKNMESMFNKMLGERMTKEGEVVNIGSEVSELPRVLYAMKNVVIAEGPAKDLMNYYPAPVFELYNRYGGWTIGYLGWIEDMKFQGASIYGQHDLPFRGATLEDYAYAAWSQEKYTMSLF
jgi:hypothetical protein